MPPLPRIFNHRLFQRLSLLLPPRVFLPLLAFLSLFAPRPFRLKPTVHQQLNLSPWSQIRFYRRLYRGYYYNEIVKYYMTIGRPDKFEPLYHQPDLDALDAAIRAYTSQGRGVLLAFAHIGPKWAGTHLLKKMGCNAVMITWNPPLLPSIHREAIQRGESTLEDANRHLFLQSYARLRNGGVVYAAPDGMKGASNHSHHFLGETIPLSAELATLARKRTRSACPLPWFGRGLPCASTPPTPSKSPTPPRIGNSNGWRNTWHGSNPSSSQTPPTGGSAPGESYRIWYNWKNKKMPAAEHPVILRLREHAERSPHQPAVTYKGRQTTYAALWEMLATRPAPEANAKRLIIALDDPFELIIQTLHAWHTGHIPVVIQNHPSVNLHAAVQRNEQEQGITEGEALILSTSGTTSYPKAVVLPQSSILANLASVGQKYGLSSEDYLLAALPLTHTIGLVGNILSGLFYGAHILLFPPNTPPPLLHQCLRENRVTIMQGSHSFFRLLHTYWRNGTPFEGVRIVSAGAETVRRGFPEIVRAMFPNAYRQMAYGQTEAGMRISQFPLDDPRAVMGCLGTPLEHFEWQLRNVDPDTKAGVFYIKGPAVMNGYITFEGGYEPVPADGFHCTNDLLILGEDGQLYFNGRANDCFKTGGKVVNPHLIESIITELDGVDMAYCYPKPHKILDFTPAVDVVLKESAAIETGAIMEYCQSRLLPHEIPKEIRIRASLPLTPSGKIKRSGAG